MTGNYAVLFGCLVNDGLVARLDWQFNKVLNRMKISCIPTLETDYPNMTVLIRKHFNNTSQRPVQECRVVFDEDNVANIETRSRSFPL